MEDEVRHQVHLTMLTTSTVKNICAKYQMILKQNVKFIMMKLGLSEVPIPNLLLTRKSLLMLCSTGGNYLLDLIFCYFQNLKSSYYAYMSCDVSISDN